MSGMASMGQDALALLPELILLAGAVTGLVGGLFLPRRRQWLVALLMAGTLLAALAAAGVGLTQPGRLIFDGSLAVDAALGVARVVVLSATLLVVCLSVERWRGHEREAEYYVMLALASLGALLLSGATDVMLVVVAYLLTSVPQYLLAAYDKDAVGTEAAMKYYLMGALLGAIMLYGLVLLYGLGGATAYGPLATGIPSSGVRVALAVATVAALAGLAFKLGAVPAHFWVPDVADGAPAPVAAYVTTVPKVAGLLATARLLTIVVPAAQVDWPLLIAVVAAASMTLGNLAAFWQDSVKRLLGYSTISQVGYLLMAVAVTGRSELAVPALLYYLAAYAVSNLAAFAVVVELPAARTIDDYAGLARRHPALALSLAVALLSLVGIPPTAGFVGKLGVFAAAWDGGMPWLAVVAAVNTVASLFYYVRWLAPTYAAVPRTPAPRLAGAWGRIGAYTAAAATLGLGIMGQLLIGPSPVGLLGGS